MRRIKLLDSLRGIACLIVVFHHLFSHYHDSFHFLKESSPWIYTIFSTISELNVEAVLFFFILSGFSIRLSIEKRPINNHKGINTYLYKRFKRILPVYYLGLAFTLLLGLFRSESLGAEFSFLTLIGNLLFLQSSANVGQFWFVPYGGNGPLWSLSYEMFYYIFFIIFHNITQRFHFLQNTKNVLVATFIVSIIGVGSRILFFNPYSAFLSYFFIWYTGVFLAEIYIKRIYEDVYIMSWSVFMIGLYVFITFYPSDTLMNIFKGGIIFLSCYFFFRNERLRRHTIYRNSEKFINTFFYKIGLGSYATYIFHFPLVIFLGYCSASLFLTISLLLILIYLCIHMEQYLVKKKFSFLKVRYIK